MQIPSTRSEPFCGFVETTGDALRLIQAARQGIIPRITRRLNDVERRTMVKSGAIFVFSDVESGIKRWTEGLSWSASRIVGNFLVYREVIDRSYQREAQQSRRRWDNQTRLSVSGLPELRTKSFAYSDKCRQYKRNGLTKKTITVTVHGADYHLVAYYDQEDFRLGKLNRLASRPDIGDLEIPPEMLESTKFRIPPITYDGTDRRPRYIRDAEENDYHGQRREMVIAMPSLLAQHAPQTTSQVESDMLLSVPTAIEEEIQPPCLHPTRPFGSSKLHVVIPPENLAALTECREKDFYDLIWLAQEFPAYSLAGLDHTSCNAPVSSSSRPDLSIDALPEHSWPLPPAFNPFAKVVANMATVSCGPATSAADVYALSCDSIRNYLASDSVSNSWGTSPFPQNDPHHPNLFVL